MAVNKLDSGAKEVWIFWFIGKKMFNFQGTSGLNMVEKVNLG